MRFSSLLLAPVLALSANHKTTSTTKNAALKKVIDLLNNMKDKAVDDKQKELLGYTAFKTWCTNTQDESEATIAKLEGQISEAEATIASEDAAAGIAGSKISDANDNISKLTDQNATNKARRNNEHTAYKAMNLELTDSINACTKALARLDTLDDAPAVFLQKSLTSVKASKGLSPSQNALLETIKRAENPFARETSSGTKNIMEMIETLKVDFVDDQRSKDKTENDSKNSYETILAQNNAELKNSKGELDRETTNKAKAEAKSAAAQSERQQDLEDKKANENYLKQVAKNCSLKSTTFGKRETSRENEILAIQSALTILSGSTTEIGAAHLTKAQKVGNFFLQLGSSTRTSDDTDTRSENAINFLRSRGAIIHSRALVQLAEMATANPFEKVVQLISGLITKLEEQAAEEASKDAQCKTDMNRTEAQITQSTNDVATYTAESDALEASVSKLTASIAQLGEDIAKSAIDNADANALRTSESALNKKVVSESQEAIEAVGKAIDVLRGYYSKVVSLVQQPPSDVMKDSGFEGQYGGLEGGASGPVPLLEVLKGNMEETVTETQAAESESAAVESDRVKAFEAKRKADRETERQEKEQKTEDGLKLIEAKESLVSSNSQLTTYNTMMTTLNLSCKVQGVSFEERDNKRKEEIASLQEAIKILEDSESSK